MRLRPVLRVVGALIYGFIGYEIGLIIVNSTTLTQNGDVAVLVSGTLLGALLGFFLAPWLVYKPAQAAINFVRWVDIGDLVAGTIGFMIGLIIAALLTWPLSRLPQPFGQVLPIASVGVFGFLGAVALLFRREDFLHFIGRGKKDANAERMASAVNGINLSGRRILLDTSVIIDGRIADIARTGFLLGTLVVPRFVLNEVQYIADSSDAMRRARGRRGLEILDKLQSANEVAIEFSELDPVEVAQVDDKLIYLAMQQSAAVLTTDFNLNRVARLQGVLVLNINELANAVKSVLLPGEEMLIRVMQEGKEVNQGVGYLEDGTMVVVENGRRMIGQEVPVQVTKVLQTNAGRLIFAAPLAVPVP